jgi:hypothetical protein
MHDFDRWPAWTRLIRWELDDPDEPECDDHERMDCDTPEDEDPTEGTYDPLAGEDEIPY